MSAIRHGSPLAVVQELVNLGSSLQYTYNDGGYETKLFLQAVRYSSVEVVSYLYETLGNPDLNQISMQDLPDESVLRTAIKYIPEVSPFFPDYAEIKNRKKVVEFLISKGAVQNIKDRAFTEKRHNDPAKEFDEWKKKQHFEAKPALEFLLQQPVDVKAAPEIPVTRTTPVVKEQIPKPEPLQQPVEVQAAPKIPVPSETPVVKQTPKPEPLQQPVKVKAVPEIPVTRATPVVKKQTPKPEPLQQPVKVKAVPEIPVTRATAVLKEQTPKPVPLEQPVEVQTAPEIPAKSLQNAGKEVTIKQAENLKKSDLKILEKLELLCTNYENHLKNQKMDSSSSLKDKKAVVAEMKQALSNKNLDAQGKITAFKSLLTEKNIQTLSSRRHADLGYRFLEAIVHIFSLGTYSKLSKGTFAFWKTHGSAFSDTSKAILEENNNNPKPKL